MGFEREVARVVEDDLRVRMVILPASDFQSGKGTQGITVLLARIFPVSANRSPVVAETLDIGVAVLRDQRRDAVVVSGVARRFAAIDIKWRSSVSGRSYPG
jgi:hypothetical protein